MPFVSVPANTWTSVHTTTEDSAFQNCSGRNIYITTASTGGLPAAEGIAVGPMNIVVIQAGKTVSAYSVGGDARVFHIGV
jgi:hypothetical protein